jgi:hypothetical protein
MPFLQDDRRRPLTLVNIAGGPAIDSLNTLILLNARQLGINAERQVSIEVLDLDDAGPAFGMSALAALSAPEGPLHGLRISFRHVPYNWSEDGNLKPILQQAHDQGALVICSSEGGLFEYGSDSEIENNLAVLRESDEVLAVVGSVTRADELSQQLRESSTAATRPRGLELFRSLVKNAGWKVAQAIERPLSDQVVLRPDPSPCHPERSGAPAERSRKTHPVPLGDIPALDKYFHHQPRQTPGSLNQTLLRIHIP